MDDLNFTGLEPELGGERRVPDTADDDYTRASPHFQQAIWHIDNESWKDAAASLRYVAGIVPYDRLVTRLFEITSSLVEGADDPQKAVTALQTFIKRVRAGEIDRSSEAAQRARILSPLLDDIPPALTAEDPEDDFSAAESALTEEPLALPAPTPLQVAHWAFFKPTRMQFYAAEEGHELLEQSGAVLVNTLMWLPMLTAALGMAVVTTLLTRNIWGWLPVLLLAIVLFVTNWLVANNGFTQVMVFASGVALIIAFFASGILPLISGPLIILCFILAVSIVPVLGGVKIGIMIRRVASGFAIVVATLVVALLYKYIMNVAQSFIGGAGSASGSLDIFLDGLTFLLGGMALTGAMMLTFALVFAFVAVFSYFTGFFLSAALETNFDTRSSAGGLFPLSFLTLSNGALLIMCLIRIWQVAR